MAITEGIIAVANHKLRTEGIESYKEYLEKEWIDKNIIKDIEIKLDNLNGEKGDLCLYCNAQEYDGKVGVIHDDECIILEIRKILK